MRVTEHLERADEPVITFEIIPPRRGGDLDSLLQLIEDLSRHRPPFIDITSHSAEVIYEETPTGLQKRVKRKRPGTLGICALIQNKFQIDAVPHVLCEGFTREESEDFLIELHYLGIDNVLAIQGDSAGYTKPLEHGRTRNDHASELIAQIVDMNKGMFLEDLLDASPTDFCIGAAGYPEKHFEAPNLETDVGWVKHKVESGAVIGDNVTIAAGVKVEQGATIECVSPEGGPKKVRAMLTSSKTTSGDPNVGRSFAPPGVRTATPPAA